jgi:hypothetical protein
MGLTVPKESRLTIQGLLLAATALAIALACVRWAVALSDAGDATQNVFPMAVMGGIVAVGSLLTAVPLLFVTLRVRRLMLGLFIVAIIATGVFASLFLFIVLQSSYNVIWVVAAPFAGFMAFLTSPLLIARWMGYRLVRQDRRAPAVTGG